MTHQVTITPMQPTAHRTSEFVVLFAIVAGLVAGIAYQLHNMEIARIAALV